MKSRKYFFSIAVASVIILFVWCSFGLGYGDHENTCNTLRDIGIIGVVVGWDGAGIEEENLTSYKEKIQKDVCQRLRQKGIKFNPNGAIDTPPFLYVEIHSYKCGSDVHAMYVIVKVMQEVVSKKNPSISFISPTWSSGGIVCIIPVETLRDIVPKLVYEFLSAYLSVNPEHVDGTEDQKSVEPYQQSQETAANAGPHDTGARQMRINIDELLKKHADAISYENMKTVNTMKLSGRVINDDGSEVPYSLIYKRPDYCRFELGIEKMNIVKAYDGNIVWQINPERFNGSLEPKEVEGTEARQFIIDSQFFPSFSSPLIDYRQRGNTVELLGIEDMKGIDVYKLMATVKFGMVTYWYISSKDYLLPKITFQAGSHDFGTRGFDLHVCLDDYKEVNGLIFPHVIEDKVAGITVQKYVVDHAEINLEIDDSIFRMPQKSDQVPIS